MTALDPRTPVIVGVGQINEREHGAEPIDLMARSADCALSDAGSRDLRRRIDAVRVVWGVWPYRDPGRLIADRLGAANARTTMTPTGGNQVYDLVIDTALRIQRGELDVVVVCAAETLRTRRADRAAGHTTVYLDESTGAEPDERLGIDRPLASEAEMHAGVDIPTNFYAMVETAIRHRNRESHAAHRRRVAELWAGASRVAAGNPDAWTRHEFTADEIAAESPQNRPVAAPYPKLLTSNLNVDQGGAVIVCSVAAATAAGVPRERWIFPIAAAGAADHWHPTNRWAFDESPAMRLSGQRSLALAGVGLDDCALLDLYSCFPAAVQVAQRELGLDPARPFTITGGLTFAAGPLNCYCILPLVRAIRVLREQVTERAFLTGNGGYFTKHSVLVLAAAPPAEGFRAESVQPDVDALPSRPTPEQPAGDATLETYTVTYHRDGTPQRGILACLDADGGRHWAETHDTAMIDELLTTDACERAVRIEASSADFA